MGRKREREPVLVQSGMKDQHLRMSSALQEYMHTHTCVNTNVRGHTNTFLKVVLGAIFPFYLSCHMMLLSLWLALELKGSQFLAYAGPVPYCCSVPLH